MTTFDKTLFKRHNIGDLVRVYTESKTIIEKAYSDLEAAQEMLKAAGVEYANTLPDRNYRWKQDQKTEASKVIGQINERLWRHVVDLMQIRKFLSIKKAEELDNELEKGKFPEITYDNIFNTFLSMMAQAEDFAAEQIREVYDWLRPRSRESWGGQYKTNNIEEIKSKVIIWGIEQPWSGTGKWRINHYSRQNFVALDKAFHTLDGAPVPTNTYGMPLPSAIESCEGSQPTGETEYFKFKLYGNGNIHITFKRLDLVREFNRVAGGGMLKKGSRNNGN